MSKSKLATLGLVAVLSIGSTSALAAAPAKAGAKCAKAGQTQVVGNKKFTCVKSKGILKWDNGQTVTTTVVSSLSSESPQPPEVTQLGYKPVGDNGEVGLILKITIKPEDLVDASFFRGISISSDSSLIKNGASMTRCVQGYSETVSRNSDTPAGGSYYPAGINTELYVLRIPSGTITCVLNAYMNFRISFRIGEKLRKSEASPWVRGEVKDSEPYLVLAKEIYFRQYESCTKAKEAGIAPISKIISPDLYEINAGLDRDKDGVACEG